VRLLRRLFALLAAVAALASCAEAGKARPVVVLDEAFVAAYPELAASLRSPSAFAGPLGSLFGGAEPASIITMTQSPGLALDAARKAETGKPGSAILVTSPLIASGLIGGGVWKGEPRILVPEWRGEGAPGLIAAYGDPIPAYRTVGTALGSYIARLAGDGGSPSCGILFSEGPSRPREALEAFALAYSAASGGRFPLIRELAFPATGSETASGEAQAASTGKEVPSDGNNPEEAVADMLGADIRVLFIALGPDTIAAIRAAARSGLALGADYSDPAASPSLAFRVIPDWDRMVKSLAGRAAQPQGGEAGAAIAVPALVEILGSASMFKAGGRGLGAFIGDARPKSAR